MRKDLFCKLFEKSDFLTMAQLESLMGVAMQTVRNHLKAAGAISRYNKRGMYYTLPTIPHFNENGVWQSEGICFSERGSLKKTFIYLITSSDKGMTSTEISDALLMPADQIINIYRHLPEVQRESINGRYIYFSSEMDVQPQQKEMRIGFENTKNKSKNLSSESGISILVEMIKNPSLEAKEIAKQLKKNCPALTEEAVCSFLEEHSLLGASEFTHVEKLNQLITSHIDDLSLQNLFPEPPVISFDIRKEDGCPEEYSVVKSSIKTVSTLHLGTFCAKNTIIATENGNMGSQELLGIVAPGTTFGFDVVAKIGDMMFLEHRQASEIKAWLADENIPISESEVEYLSKKYIIYLSLIHEQSTPKIVEIMKKNGGYILHLDALGAKGGERLMTGIDSLSDLVLNNEKISSENSEEIISFLKIINSRYGKPLRVVQDMGKGIMNAVKEVFPKVPILICHFHFLRDMGKDLLKSSYDIITKRLTHFGFLVKLRTVRTELKIVVEENPALIEHFHNSLVENKKVSQQSPEFLLVMLYTLLEWILNWKDNSAGYGFPFDRPKYDLAIRMSEAWTILCDMPEDLIVENAYLKKHYDRAKVIISSVVNDKELQEAIECIEPEIVVFDKLRDAMRMAPKDGENGLNDNNDSEDIKTIESSVVEFMKEPEVLAEFSTDSRRKSFFDQLEKYWSQLFADPITVKIEGQDKVIAPQRTNNLMERFFRDFSRGSKRKTGCDNIGRMIQGMASNTPLVKNFQNEKYLKATLGEKTLREAFSEIDNDLVVSEMKELNINDEKIHDQIKKCLRFESLPKRMSDMAKKMKSN
jgi:hypothetical protein